MKPGYIIAPILWSATTLMFANIGTLAPYILYTVWGLLLWGAIGVYISKFIDQKHIGKVVLLVILVLVAEAISDAIFNALFTA